MSIIKTITQDLGQAESARRISYVTGVPLVKESWYRHSETGVEYWHIAAGVAHQTDQPGAVVVVGARKSEPIVMEAIAMAQGPSLKALINAAAKARKRYRSADGSLLRIMWGDPKKFTGLIGDYNRGLNEIEKVFVAPPPDWKGLHAGLTYWRTIENYGLSEVPQLHLSGCPDLHASVQAVIGSGVMNRQAPKDFPPPVMALGYAIHAMRAHKPWIRHGEILKYASADPLEVSGWAEKEVLETLCGFPELEGFGNEPPMETLF